MWKIQIREKRVEIGERFAISFQRTLRIPDDGKVYPLPPSLGGFPVLAVEDFHERLPVGWREQGGVFIPMYQREAMWLAFEAASWKPNAVKIGIGMINALTGEEWVEPLNDDPQDYLVCPNQPWLDGINVGEGVIRQFVAMSLGEGYTVEGQLSGKEQFGGIQVLVFDPRPGLFPDKPPSKPAWDGLDVVPEMLGFTTEEIPVQEMGLAAGGQIIQKIYPDPHGLKAWDVSNFGKLTIHIVNSMQYEAITGQSPPSSPISAKTYTDYGLPWFELYDEESGLLAASRKLSGIKSVKQVDTEKGITPSAEDEPVEVKPEQIKRVHRRNRR